MSFKIPFCDPNHAFLWHITADYTPNMLNSKFSVKSDAAFMSSERFTVSQLRQQSDTILGLFTLINQSNFQSEINYQTVINICVENWLWS